MDEIYRFQSNLLLMRRILGWSAEELGDHIGVTRQTINNLEAGRNKLNKAQYIALRAIFDAEMINSPNDTEILRYLLEILVDNPDMYSDEFKGSLSAKATMLAPAIAAKITSRGDVSKELVGIITSMGIEELSKSKELLGVTNAWLLKAMNTSNIS